MSLSIGTSRSTLLAEARQDWAQQQQRKALMQGKTDQASAQPPSDAELIAMDAQLKKELAKLTSSTDEILSAATSTSESSSSSSDSSSGSSLSILA